MYLMAEAPFATDACRVVPEASWVYAPQRPCDTWGADVRLFGSRIVGVVNERSWFCLDRNGAVLWERRGLGRPNHPNGLAGEVLVAAERRGNDGPWIAEFGVYGIDLTSGRLLWTSHAPGGWGRFVRLLDFVPDFTNEIRDSPHAVLNGEIVTESGRRLDPRTGRDLGRLDALPPGLRADDETFSRQLLVEKKVSIGALGVLIAGRPGEHQERGLVEAEPLRFHLVSPEGDVRWVFDGEAEERIAEPGYWELSFDRFGDYVLLIVADSTTRSEGLAPRSLLFLDLRNGQVSEATSISHEPLRWACLAGADAEGLLISACDASRHYRLMHFPWDPGESIRGPTP